MTEHRVVAVASDGLALFELGVAVEVFARPRRDLGVEWYDFALCAPQSTLSAIGGFRLDGVLGVDALDDADTVVAVGWPPDLEPPADLVAALRRAAARGARLVSFCSGAFLLAGAGVLDGHRATTHWMYAQALADRYPRIAVDPGVLYVDDGRVLTSAGTAAAVDLALHLVRRDHGADVANAVARRMVMPPHRDGGQAQFVRSPLPTGAVGDHDLRAVLEWVRTHLDEPITLEDMASRAFMSTRTFTRRFREATGTSPRQWLLFQRLDSSRELLETTDHTLDRIAALVGFGSPVTLRHHFARALGVSPAAYRRSFRRVDRIA